jgi:ABC-type branched-subunit amino acid transport system ATPase component/ABC-type branched-subunit amino acid transport system permease subunit
MLAASLFTADLLFSSLIGGLIISLTAMGIILIYRSSRVINFAVGAIGVPATALFAVMAGAHSWPYWPALVAALAVGVLSGTLVDLVVIRRLAKAPRVILLVATIGVADLMYAITLSLPDYKTGSLQTQFPLPFEGEWNPFSTVVVDSAELFVLIVVPLIVLGMWWGLGHTAFGDSVRASSTNADLARMTGISPKWISTAVWSIAGFLSFAAIFLTATQSASTQLVSIGPQTLLRGMVAALIGGMVSFPRAMAGAIVIATADRLLYFHFPNDTGIIELLLFIAVLILVSRVGREAEAGGESFQFAPRPPAIPEHLRKVWWVRRLPQFVAVFALLVAIIAPQISDLPSRNQLWAQILAFAICAVSVTVLTGWAGQLSLGQMAFAGVAALVGAAFGRGETFDVGWRSAARFSGTLPTVSFPWTVLIGAVAATLTALIVGVGALRVKGLLLAVSTLSFAIACQVYVFEQPFFKESASSVRISRGELIGVDLSHFHRAFYYFVLLLLVVVLLSLGHLKRSGVGRMIVGVRENESAAAAMTISPTRAKLTAFAVSGFVAGLGGVMLAMVNTSFDPAARYFRVDDSLKVVAMAVIGGLGSLAGPVIGALWVAGLPAFWEGNELVPLFTSSIGLLLILLYLPGGFVQIGNAARAGILRWLEKRLPPEPVKTATEAPPALQAIRPKTELTLNKDGSAVAARGVTVSFGGLVAVNEVDLVAAPGEVIGLIGNNGAGKSTLLNAIGGYVPSNGTVELLGLDVSRRKPHERAALGLGRTFQAATLYPDLTVRDTVMLALEARQRTSFWSTLTCMPWAFAGERQKRAEAGELIDFLGLGRYGDRFIAELSTGTRRIVELACVLAVAPRVICLDEPTAGIAQREAEAFGPLIKVVQQELDATLVVVEHDLPLILSISDRVYCLEAGRVIASGSPEEVRTDPRVVSSYLGTDERAIQRSDAR